MVKAAASISSELENVDNESDLTDLSELEETLVPTFGELSPTRSFDSTSLVNSPIIFRPNRTVTYRTKERITKRLKLQSKFQDLLTETEAQRRVTKRTRPESSLSMLPNLSAKRRKVGETSSSTFGADFFTSSTPISTRSSSSEFDGTFGDKDVVWVKVDLRGEVVESDRESDSSYWWPAQVLEDDPTETTIELFGKSKHNAQMRVKLPPSSFAILSFRRDGQLRFDESFFDKIPPEIKSQFEDMLSNFIKKWKIAFTEALQAEKEDTLPDAISLIYEVSPSKNTIKPQKEPSLSQTSFEPLPDESVKVGEEDGELVLASDRRNRSDHWPARVVGRSFNKRTRRWMYEVCYMDGGRQKVDRSMFFTFMEPGFGTCQVGRWKIIKPRSSGGSDEEEDERTTRQGVDDPSCSCPSSPDLPDIKDTNKFFNRSLAYQMKYVYPILCHAIRREYPPSVKLHDAFIRGGKARQVLVQSAANYGQFSENEVKKIANFLRKTMLCDEQWGERIVEDDMDNQSAQEGTATAATKRSGDMTKDKGTIVISRPQGCDEYENLSRADRGLYSTDVLLHIAILQLHLLRSGERRSWKMESEEQENTLYLKGSDLMDVRPHHHWVNEIFAMRQIAENLPSKKAMQKHPLRSNEAGDDEGSRDIKTEDTCSIEAIPADSALVPMTRSMSRRQLGANLKKQMV